MSASPSSAPAPGSPRLAVLYLPPILNLHGSEDELATLGRKLSASLDKFAADNAALYESHAATVTIREQEQGICRLTRRAGPEGRLEPLADVFMVDYRPLLMARYRQAGLLRKVLLAALGLVVMAAKGLRALGNQPFKVKRLRDRFQALYALACFSIVFLYLGLLVLASLSLIHKKIEAGKRPEPSASAATNASPIRGFTGAGRLDLDTVWPSMPLPQPGLDTPNWLTPPGVWDQPAPLGELRLWNTNDHPGGPPWQLALEEPAAAAEGGWLAAAAGGIWEAVSAPVRYVWDLDPASTGLLLLALTALGFAGGQGGENRIRAFINRASEEMLAFIYYLSFNDRRPEITGRFDARLEEVMELGAYQRFVVLGYSFGTVVALDAFCPACDVRARRLDQVDTLVTIGSPYDFILTYWPRYFADRQHAPPKTWLNVYSPVDLLGTCFDKEQARRARAGRQPGAQPRVAGRDEPQNSFGQRDQLATGPTQEFAFREGIPDEQLGLFGWIAMQGLGAHSRYWATGEDAERNCFDLLVSGMFPEEFTLRAPAPGPNPASAETKSAETEAGGSPS